ncbi:MAG: helix-turn-helix transcriptional regulator [Verrucomicrobia bacterium]|nr:helix-turn-helix transcriptional regulator [Verrucomicrobiota bacterium]
MKTSDPGQFLRSIATKVRPTAKNAILKEFEGQKRMHAAGVLPVRAVEVIRNGCAMCPFPTLSSLSSEHAGWDGIAMESFSNVPAVAIPDHDHPTHFINLLTHGNITAEWTVGGKTGKAEAGPGDIYMLPAGTRDRLTWSGPTSRIVLVMEPRFLARSLEESARLDDVELFTHWNLRDRHIQTLILALHADLQDGSPAGPLYGESLAVALGHYLIRRHSFRAAKRISEIRGGMPSVRLNRVLDFMNHNVTRDLRLGELAQVAGMSPNYFCQLFKQTTGLTAHQYVLRMRIDRAKRYLRDPKATLGMASAASGFADQSHFTKVFRRMVGVTPAQFRVSS